MDGHKTEETKRYRKLCVQDMVALEMWMYQWVQMPVAKAKEHEEKDGLVYKSGYFYTDKETNKKMAEYHVDACENSTKK